MLSHGELTGARAAVGQAITLELEALKASPKNPEQLRFLARHYEVLARAELGLGDHAAATTAARDLAAKFPTDPRQLRIAAGIAARCATSADKDRRLTEPEQTTAVSDYTGESLALLRRAASNGFRDGADLRADPHVARLLETDEYRQFTAEMDRPAAK